MDGFLERFSNTTTAETKAQDQNARHFRQMLQNASIGIGRKISISSWAKSLAKTARKYDDFEEVLQWLRDNYEKIWFLPNAIQSPEALWRKYERVRVWKNSTSRAQYNISDNETMTAVYAMIGDRLAGDIFLVGVDSEQFAFITFEFVQFIRELVQRIEEYDQLNSVTPAETQCILMLREYAETMAIVEEYLRKLLKDLELWENSGRMQVQRYPKTNLVPREWNRKCEGYVKWILSVKMKGRFLPGVKKKTFDMIFMEN